MKSIKNEITDWIRGYKFGYTIKDKLILLTYILNGIIILTLLYVISGKEKTGKVILSRPNLLNWIPTKKITINRDGVLLSVPTVIDYMIFVKLDWENEEKEFAIKHSMNDGLILDVGSNVGYYTCILAKKYQNSKIISVEASPSIFDILKDNCKLNNFSNVILYNYAITDKDDTEIDFYKHDSMSTTDKQTLTDWSIPQNQIKKEKTKTLTIDKLLKDENIGKIQFCKIDIEGAEIMALRGARYTLKKKLIQNMMIEYHSYSNRDYIVNLLKEMDYLVSVKERDILFENKDHANGHIFATLTNQSD